MAEAIVLWSNWCRSDGYLIRVTLPDGGGALDVVPAGSASCMNRAVPSTLLVEGFTSLAAESSSGNRVIAVQQAPHNVAAGRDTVWIVGQDRLVRLDTDGRIERVFDLQAVDGAFIGGGHDVAVGEGSVWATCACGSEPDPRYGATSGGLVRIDPRDDRVTAVKIFTDRTPGQVLASNGAVWVTSDRGVTRLSKDLAVEATVGLETDFLASGEDRIWALSGTEEEAFLSAISTTSNRVVSRRRLPHAPGGVVEAFGSVWVSARRSGQLMRIDPITGEIEEIAIPISSAGPVMAVEGWIWIASQSDGALLRFDPRTERVTATYDIGTDPADIAVGRDAAWVVNYSDWTVTRIPL
jgi:streptogramin lyase